MNKVKVLILVSLTAAAAYLSLSYPHAPKDILLNLRFPRVLQGFFTGFSLAVSGAILQGILKNPLADPFIMGVSGGAMLVLLFCKVFSIPDAYFLPAAGGMAAAYFSYIVSRKFSGFSNAGVILSGIAVNAFITALITIFVIFRKDDLIYFFHFSFGNISGVNHREIIYFSIMSCLVFLFFFLKRKSFLAMAFDEVKAVSMGLNAEREKILFFALASLLASFSVGMSGLVGFVGLVGANLARFIFPFSSREYILSCGFIGALLTVSADFAGRAAASPIEIPVGALTAFLGAPFFIYLLYREGKR